MSARRVLGISVMAGAAGIVAGTLIGGARPALAQRFDAAYAAGTYQVSAGQQNEAWRVNTSTGEVLQCLGGQVVTCRRAELK